MNMDKGYIIIEEHHDTRTKHRHSLTKKTGAGLGICEQLRFVYDTIYDSTLDEETKEKLTEQLTDAFIMAKKMQKRLDYYYLTYKDTTGKGGKGLNVLQNNGARARMRDARPR